MARPLSRKYKRPGGYIQIWAEWFNSPAYRSLKPPARCLLAEFLLINRPSRNGQLSIGTRRAAELVNVSENTATKAFHELAEHGFIALAKGHMWMERRTREWRLTIMECNEREPTDDWRKWESGKPVVVSRKKSRP